VGRPLELAGFAALTIVAQARLRAARQGRPPGGSPRRSRFC